MLRRYSICITDLPSCTQVSGSASEPSFDYRDPSCRSALCRNCCSVPLMASMVLPQLDGYAENRRAKKNAHKKKKKKKQNKKKQSSQGDSNAPSCSESPPSYKSTADDADAAQSRAPSSVDTLRLPLIVDGASWGKKHSQAQSQCEFPILFCGE